MKSTKRIALVLVMALMLCGVVKTEVMAYDLYYEFKEVSGSDKFKGSWKVETEFFPVKGEVDDWGVMITYGYNKGWISKKDYVTEVGGQPSGCSSYGVVVNADNNWAYTNVVDGSHTTGKAELKHTGDKVRYGVYLRIGN